MKRGYTQVYTGDGKGKTTAALGLAVRAGGRGLRVYMVQFMKNDQEAGEIRAAELLGPRLSIRPMGAKGFVRGTPRPIDCQMAQKALDLSNRLLQSGEYDVIILDEINMAVHLGLITLQDVLALMDAKPDSVELVMTGREAHPEVIEKADLVTEMVNVKHYFERGVKARNGIER